MHNLTKLNKSGFTLIELLAVIAIIVILSGIIIPIVGSVRDSARTAQSLSNLRQLASALQMYASDNKGLYPIGYDDPSRSEVERSGPERYWYLEAAEYINQKTTSNFSTSNILVSPFVGETKKSEESFNTSGDLLESPSTYSVHGIICPSIVKNGIDRRFPVWNIRENPAEIILIGEGTLKDDVFANATFLSPDIWFEPRPNTLTDEQLNRALNPTTENTEGALSYRANGYALVAFLDGHVEAIKKGNVRNRNVVITE